MVITWADVYCMGIWASDVPARQKKSGGDIHPGVVEFSMSFISSDHPLFPNLPRLFLQAILSASFCDLLISSLMTRSFGMQPLQTREIQTFEFSFCVSS